MSRLQYCQLLFDGITLENVGNSCRHLFFTTPRQQSRLGCCMLNQFTCSRNALLYLITCCRSRGRKDMSSASHRNMQRCYISQFYQRFLHLKGNTTKEGNIYHRHCGRAILMCCQYLGRDTVFHPCSHFSYGLFNRIRKNIRIYQ